MTRHGSDPHSRDSNDRISLAVNCPDLCRLGIFAMALAFGNLANGETVDKKKPPEIKAVAPLAIAVGVTNELALYGFNLDKITELRFPELKTAPVYKIKSNIQAPRIDRVPADLIGDRCLNFEILLPVDTPSGITTLTVIGSDGKSEPRKILIVNSTMAVSEKEPNDGFAQAQNAALGHTIIGNLSERSKTDTFSFTGEVGQRIVVEVQSAQFGSLLEPVVVLQNLEGQVIAERRSGPQRSDPVLETTLLQSGPHFITIRDAKETSSPLHAYVIRTRLR